ncbi:MAG: nitrate reductase associated protein [Chitinophagaceae bacterium]|nr:MAG: nitrate reductase associated protein [Chitinophagaceae bacterium]
MQTRLWTRSPSEFKSLEGIEYFNFEEEFMEKGIRCIPMIIRFKLDMAGIKLKLNEWNKLLVQERIDLACRPCNNEEEAKKYRQYLSGLVRKRCNREPTDLAIAGSPGWADRYRIPDLLLDKLKDTDLFISIRQWQRLTNLQRFALIKLCRPGHESKNFPKALREFGIISSLTPSC